jgi:CelD/BcsL family acetyltransferase involved in cellulose biosynthesis
MNAPLLHSDTHDATPLCIAGHLRISIYQDIEDIETLWRSMETRAITTAYQSYDWCRLWLEHVGNTLGITPVIVVGNNHFGEPLFILPLQLRKSVGLRVIEALTAPLGAYAFGVFENRFYGSTAHDWFAAHLATIISMLPKHDVFRLADIVETVAGHANPLLAAGFLKAANECHMIDLKTDFDLFYKDKRPGRRRRYLRNRDGKLESMGKLEFTLPTTTPDISKAMQTMFADQEQRLAEAGIRNVFTENEKSFFTELAQCSAQHGKLLQPFALKLDNITLATISGLHFNNTFWALISSLASHDARKHSPGDYALRQVFKVMCERGAQHYDFSVGHADYKEQWSDRRLQLFFILRANSPQGFAMALLMLAKEKTKRLIKTQSIAFTALSFIRRSLRGTQQSSGSNLLHTVNDHE